LIEFGIQSHCNSPRLWKYCEKKKIQVVPFPLLRNGRATYLFEKSLTRLASQCDVVVISLSLESAAACYAPGVSAPQAEGFTASEIIEMMEMSGRQKKVKSLGIFELNPLHDVEDLTARLAATAAYHFIESALY
jgi:formiminoglutamase